MAINEVKRFFIGRCRTKVSFKSPWISAGRGMGFWTLSSCRTWTGCPGATPLQIVSPLREGHPHVIATPFPALWFRK